MKTLIVAFTLVGAQAWAAPFLEKVKEGSYSYKDCDPQGYKTTAAKITKASNGEILLTLNQTLVATGLQTMALYHFFPGSGEGEIKCQRSELGGKICRGFESWKTTDQDSTTVTVEKHKILKVTVHTERFAYRLSATDTGLRLDTESSNKNESPFSCLLSSL